MHKVAFAKVFQTCKNGDKFPFCVESDEAKLEGVLSFSSNHSNLLKLEGILSGTITLICDVSGEEYVKTLEEPLEFYLSETIVSLDNEHFEEIVECENGVIDFNEILCGELEMIRCDYHTKDEFKE
ncbi:hypothetical protein [Helicobacter sp. MIT 05-5294]|uniref:hypothetical protein n=1 Tax=Helicobacter sp. MIT 05-5294 TaxID=1548150 RepID=UPI00051FE7ED|nr:hypothetical protein [Helicobacter sp. MIT 05-5294]TLD86496.1 hypothetical protein LS69_005705 [Helicobacter sp. MIT 05-5294]